MTSKHTPGPWHVFDGHRPGIETADDFSIVIYGIDFESDECGVWGNSQDEAIANARLIAAAPDILEALKGTLASLVALTSIVIRAEDEKTRPSKVVASDTMFLQMLKDYDAATISARVAIAKATGGQS